LAETGSNGSGRRQAVEQIMGGRDVALASLGGQG